MCKLGTETCTCPVSPALRFLQRCNSAALLHPSLFPPNAGILAVRVVSIEQRPPPTRAPALAAGTNSSVPYHLDRIDQRSLPLDGQFMSTALGTGVNVYIISSVSMQAGAAAHAALLTTTNYCTPSEP